MFHESASGGPRIWSSFSPSRKPCVLGCRPLRRTIQVRLGFDLGFRISDLGFLNTNVDIKLNSSDFAIGSRILTSFSANFHSAFRNRQSGGTPIFAVSSHQFMKLPGWLSPSSLWHHVCIKIPMRWAGSSPIPFP